MTKLDRLARSLPDTRDIADELTSKGVALSLGSSVYDPTDPVGRLLFKMLSMVAESEADLIRMRTREGMAVARAKGRLRGKQPKLSASQRRHLLTLHHAGEHTQAELFSVSRTTVYPRSIEDPAWLLPWDQRWCVDRLRPPSLMSPAQVRAAWSLTVASQ